MSDIDYQNGFLCGMATKGLMISGEEYEPKIWNDSGIYSYFYIDFMRGLETFSNGMWDESIILYDSKEFETSKIEFISTGVYKVYADISSYIKGVTVINKSSSLLAFSNGEKVYPFSVMFIVSGLGFYDRLKYAYDEVDFTNAFNPTTVESNIIIDMSESFSTDAIYENTTLTDAWKPSQIIESNILVKLT